MSPLLLGLQSHHTLCSSSPANVMRPAHAASATEVLATRLLCGFPELPVPLNYGFGSQGAFLLSSL